MTTDQFEIQAMVDALDNAVDEKNWTLARSYFANTIHVDFSANGGGPASDMPADNLIGIWAKNLYPDKKSFHLRGNHSTTVDGDHAINTSKGYAFNMLPSGPVAGIWEIWGCYTYTLERTSTGWKLTGMTLVPVATRGDARIPGFQPG